MRHKGTPRDLGVVGGLSWNHSLLSTTTTTWTKQRGANLSTVHKRGATRARFCYVYIDDILIVSTDEQEQKEHLQ